jgi:hypothetical protein
MEHPDTQVRLAAFRFLEEQLRLASDEGALPRKLLEQDSRTKGNASRSLDHKASSNPVCCAKSLSVSRRFRSSKAKRDRTHVSGAWPGNPGLVLPDSTTRSATRLERTSCREETCVGGADND